MHSEVRYHMLRPEQIVARRQQCPIGYVPIGTLEWHGRHNPVGTDTLQAEAIAIRCAEKGGGLVFPPLYYGESRVAMLMESDSVDREQIAEQMQLPAENFSAERIPFSASEQMFNYQRLLVHILAEVESLGFEVGVLVCGHYPLVDFAQAAVLMFNQVRRPDKRSPMRAWAFVDYVLLQDEYDCAGDHAGGWETSHMLAIHPETVDLSTLPPKGEKLIGAGGKMAPQDATAEFGRETIEKAVDLAVAEAQHRLSHPELYKVWGNCLRENLWRTDR